jgi:hypothetical protein
MERTKEQIEKLMTVDNVTVLLTALEVIANGDPISVGLDEITDVAQNALDYFDDSFDDIDEDVILLRQALNNHLNNA